MGETHTHTNTRARAHSTHVKLRILTGRAGPPATQPVPTAGRTEAGKGCAFLSGTFTESLVLIKAD